MSATRLPAAADFLTSSNKMSDPSIETQINHLIAAYPEAIRRLNFLKNSIATQEAEVDGARNSYILKLQNRFCLLKSSGVINGKKLVKEQRKSKVLSMKVEKLEERLCEAGQDEDMFLEEGALCNNGNAGSGIDNISSKENHEELKAENSQLSTRIKDLEHELRVNGEKLQNLEDFQHGLKNLLEKQMPKREEAVHLHAERAKKSNDEIRRLTVDLKNAKSKINSLQEQVDEKEEYIESILSIKNLDEPSKQSRRVSVLEFLRDYPDPPTASQVNLLID